MKRVVWGRASSINVQKVMWCLAELELEVERRDAGGSYGIVDTEPYGRLNPNRTVPTLVEDDFVLWESNAIVRYLAGCHGEHPFWPKDLQARALADRWLDWSATVLMPAMRPVFMALVRSPEAHPGEAALARAIEATNRHWAVLDEYIEGCPFVEGDSLTIADIAPGAGFYRWTAMNVDRPPMPALEAWYQQLTERPAFREHVMLPLV